MFYTGNRSLDNQFSGKLEHIEKNIEQLNQSNFQEKLEEIEKIMKIYLSKTYLTRLDDNRTKIILFDVLNKCLKSFDEYDIFYDKNKYIFYVRSLIEESLKLDSVLYLFNHKYNEIFIQDTHNRYSNKFMLRLGKHINAVENYTKNNTNDIIDNINIFLSAINHYIYAYYTHHKSKIHTKSNKYSRYNKYYKQNK